MPVGGASARKARGAGPTALLAAVAVLAAALTGVCNSQEPSLSTEADETRLEGSSSEQSSSLDRIHDWLYQAMQDWIEKGDTWFAGSTQRPLPVPPSSLRLGFEGTLLHGPSGTALIGGPDVEGTLKLPNIERRLRGFVTTTDVQESPADPARQTSPVRLGLRVTPIAQLAFDAGVRTAIHPSVFATLKWTPTVTTTWLTVLPFAKAYAESRVGAGLSSGVALERWHEHWMVRTASYANWLRSISGASSANWSQTVLAGRVFGLVPEQQYGNIAEGKDIACGAVLRLYVSGDNDSRASFYESGIILKHRIHSSWLLAYIEPVVRWDRNEDWHPDVGIQLGVDVLFWGLAAHPSSC